MPPKIRELVRDLLRAGFVEESGKGSHRRFEHPATHTRVILSGQMGADAKPYQQQEVAEALKKGKL